VEILLGTQRLEPRRYLVTVAEQLERLGHEVRVFAAEPMPSTDELRVVGVERELPLAPDAIYSQDVEAALLLADLYPLTAQVFVAHGDGREVWLPPQLAGIVSRVVVLDDRTADRARAAALPHELVRLRRPVDLQRAVPRSSLPERPRRARVELDGLSDYRRGLVQRACADARIETGGDDPDVVIGRGTSIVEAMASGLAAYVYGDEGGDGWVTPERYERLEADGFSGRADATATDFERLRRDLDAYDAATGLANRELAQAHDARRHAQELVAVFEQVGPRREPVSAPLRELARLVRVEASSARRAEVSAAAAAEARARMNELEGELEEARTQQRELSGRVAELERALAAAQAEPDGGEAQRPRRVRGLLGREGKVPSSEG
jgi:hypothetical protein